MTVIEHVNDLPEPDRDDQTAAVFPDNRYLFSVASVPVLRKLTPTEKKKARAKLSEFFHLAEQNRDRITYTQHRPFVRTVDPRAGFRGDCSSYETQAMWWVLDQLDGPPIHDPNGIVEWDGWGYTGTLLATNHAHPVPEGRRYLVGDIAVCGTFWRTVHAFQCSKPGDAAAAEWSSHGSGAGPLKVRLHYRPDVLTVLRPVSLL